MGAIITVLIIIVCILLILIVLVQNSKGGGLSSSFSSSNQIMGVRKTSDFLEKATWGLAGALLVLCLLSTPSGSTAGAPEESTAESVTKKKAAEAPVLPQQQQMPQGNPTPQEAPPQNK